MRAPLPRNPSWYAPATPPSPYAPRRWTPKGSVSAVRKIALSAWTDATFGLRRISAAARADPRNWKPLSAWS